MKKLFIFILCALTVLPICSCAKKIASDKYNIEITYNEDNTLDGVMEFTFNNRYDNAFTYLEFEIYANAYRENAKYSPVSTQYVSKAYPNGISYGNINVGSCKCGESDLSFEITGEDENILKVALLQAVYPGESVTVKVIYGITLANVMHRLGYTDKTVNLAEFYPVLCAVENGNYYECVYSSSGDPFYTATADYSVKLNVPGRYTVAATGTAKSCAAGDNTVFEFTADNVRDFAIILSDKFNIAKKTCGGISVNYYYLSDETPETTLNEAVEMLEWYQSKFGEYVYPVYNIAQTDFVYAGMEYPCLVYISDKLTGKDLIYTLAHETAHQWWYGMVGCNEYEEAYIDEGLAEYSSYLFFDEHDKYNIDSEAIISSALSGYKSYYDVYKAISGEVNTVMNRKLTDFAGEIEYLNIAYNKSLLMFDGYETAAGRAKAYKALNKFYTRNLYGIAGYDDIVSSFGLGEYFSAYVEGKVLL